MLHRNGPPSPPSGRRPQGLILLPLSLPAAVVDDDIRRFLARGDLRTGTEAASDLDRLLEALGEPPAAPSGLAALRLWGQTGERPDDWVVGADPVWLQAGLDKLYLHAPPPGDVAPADLRRLLADLTEQVLGEGGGRLEAVDACGYLTGRGDIATAPLPAEALSGERPDAYMPTGPEARAYLALCGELQMSLHEHPVNRAREAAGRRPLNSLWLWGGGRAPRPQPRPLPSLFSDRPLLRGHWQACGQSVSDWPGSLAACADATAGAFVATAPADGLRELRSLWPDRRLRRVTLLFADGARLELRGGLRGLLRRRSRAVMTLEGDAR